MDIANDLWAALALVLVIEGLLPFISPRIYRQSAEQLSSLPDRMIRMIGLAVIVIGLVSLSFIRG
ncbi:MAG: DUF2065 domain-containing protein [Halothiobacillaceae bacterium]